MYKTLRKKVASTVNDIDAPEQFEWQKWLRTPATESLSIDRIYHSVQNINDLNLELPVPTSDKIEFNDIENELLDGRYQKRFFIPKVKTNKIFLRLTLPQTKNIQLYDPSGTKILFTSKVEHKDNKIIITNKSGRATSKLMESSAAVKNYIFLILDPTISKLDFLTTKPVIFDKMQNLVAEVTNVQLLNFLSDTVKIDTYNFLTETPEVSLIEISDIRKLLDSLYNQKIDTTPKEIKIDYLNSSPKITKAKILSRENIKVPTYYLKNIYLKKIKISVNLLQSISEAETYQKELSSYSFAEPVEEEIVYLPVYEDQSILDYVDHLLNDNKTTNDLEPGPVIEEEKDKDTDTEEPVNISLDLNDYLLDFQKEGVKFLSKNKACLLNDEPGLGKTIQVVSALKMLLESGKIKSFLILCRNEQIGNLAYTEQLGKPVGWEGHLIKFLDKDYFLSINGEKEGRIKLWKEKKTGYLAAYNNFASDMESGSVNKDFLSNIDCIVFDDVEEFSKVNPTIANTIVTLPSKYRWYLSGLSEKSALENLKGIQKFKDKTVSLRRTKEELFGILPNIVRKEVWVELDNEQKVEYDNTLKLGKEKIAKLMQAGNPFIVQSNIYTLIHQLKQICNFPESKSSSPKADSLIKKIGQLIENNKKVMIVSQYDKSGTNKIGQLLRENGIKFLSCHNGMSITEVDNIKKQFKRDKKTFVLINGLKSSRTPGIAEVGYFIHFDQWWNPSTVWKMEDTISKPHEDNYKLKENIIIYEYFTKNTYEEDLRKLLFRKGLLNRDIIELLTADTINEIVTIDEWLEILGVNPPTNEDPASEKLKLISKSDLTRKIEIFFSRIGYKNVSLSKGKRSDEYNIVGTLMTENKRVKMAAKCLLSEEFTTDDIMEQINRLEIDKNSEKKFLIHLNESSESLLSLLKPSIIVINKELLANYLSDFLLI